MEIATNPAPAITSEKPLGRKGRLADLAATISSWEDDREHPPTYRDNEQGQTGTACVPPTAHVGMSTSVKPISVAQQAKNVQPVASKPVHSTQQVGDTNHIIIKKCFLFVCFCPDVNHTSYLFVLDASLFPSQVIQSDPPKSTED